jgi:hypothetical protein
MGFSLFWSIPTLILMPMLKLHCKMSTHTGLVLTANGHTCKYIAELFGVKNFFSQADTTIDANALLANGKLPIPSAADRHIGK